MYVSGDLTVADRYCELYMHNVFELVGTLMNTVLQRIHPFLPSLLCIDIEY